MKIFDWNKSDIVFSFKLDMQSDADFHFSCGNTVTNKVYVEADLCVEEAPVFLEKTLERSDHLIFLCRNIKVCSGNHLKGVPPKLIIKMFSKILGQLQDMSLKRKLAGVLFILPRIEIESLTELQKHWLRDFAELFIFINETDDGMYRLYMPTSHDSYKHYLALDELLERSISTSCYSALSF